MSYYCQCCNNKAAQYCSNGLCGQCCREMFCEWRRECEQHSTEACERCTGWACDNECPNYCCGDCCDVSFDLPCYVHGTACNACSNKLHIDCSNGQCGICCPAMGRHWCDAHEVVGTDEEARRALQAELYARAEEARRAVMQRAQQLAQERVQQLAQESLHAVERLYADERRYADERLHADERTRPLCEGRACQLPGESEERRQAEERPRALREETRQAGEQNTGQQNTGQQNTGEQNTGTVPGHCVVCWEAPVNSAFYGCGHAVTCLPCARKCTAPSTGELRCPLCNGSAQGVLRLYF
eukprot:TRINITY_DN2091_c0_g2_i1.p1 TRINITY_DN2091_c0_g2~~TRINITY_DN2091_c0_g2_i1.p1  ORF type:complete len:299 (-),score=35.10 TRINITY_DN2091_c0_g2_i1:173-1069(-)